jgi:anthranilate synthase component 2
VVIDNYDSFTYNLVQYLWDEGTELVVFKNDEKTCDEIAAMNPRGILISPGPGAPEDSGIALQACAELGPRFPLFGVCMGHQCIGQVFGGAVVRAPTGLMHGKQSPVFHDPTDVGGLLEGMPRRVAENFARAHARAKRAHAHIRAFSAFPLTRACTLCPFLCRSCLSFLQSVHGCALPQPGHRARELP